MGGLSRAFGSTQQLDLSPRPIAIDMQGASFSWTLTSSAQEECMENAWSLVEGNVLKELSISVLGGQLAVVQGTVGTQIHRDHLTPAIGGIRPRTEQERDVVVFIWLGEMKYDLLKTNTLALCANGLI